MTTISIGRLKALRSHMRKMRDGDASDSLHDSDRSTIVRALEYVVDLAQRPCQIGHVDKKRCWQHERDWPRDNWCEPCECEHVVMRGGAL